jgi:hypothetical protein
MQLILNRVNEKPAEKANEAAMQFFYSLLTKTIGFAAGKILHH